MVERRCRTALLELTKAANNRYKDRTLARVHPD